MDARCAIVLMGFSVACATGQSVQQPSFEAAEIRVSRSGGPISGDLHAAGQLWLRSLSLKQLIAGAWHVKEYAVVGGPAWIDSDRFDVIAKAPPNAAGAEIQGMLRSLLQERLKLVVRSSETDVQVYALIGGKRGAKIQATTASDSEGSGCTGQREGGQAHRTCRNMSMGMLAGTLPSISPHYVDLPVVDLTGLKGRYDFTLSWLPQQLRGDSLAGGPTIFEALDTQLGLKLERRKLAVPTVVIDSVERTPKEH